MSSKNDRSIKVCSLGNVKVGGLLGLGVQGISLIFTYFCFLTYSDSVLLTDISSDIVKFSQSLGLAHTVLSSSLFSFIPQLI